MPALLAAALVTACWSSAPLPPLPCHHGGPCPPVPSQLVPRLHNSPPCLQTEAPHDMAATITRPHPDGGVVHHVFQFCIPCERTSNRSTCYYGPNNPNSASDLPRALATRHNATRHNATRHSLPPVKKSGSRQS